MTPMRRFFRVALLALSVPSAAVTTKIEVVPAEAARPSPSALPSIQAPLSAPLLAPPAVPLPEPLAPINKTSEAPGTQTQTDSGPTIFDGNSSDRPPLPEADGPPDIIPVRPAQTGDAVRIAGRTYVLAERMGEVLQANGHRGYEGTNRVFRAKDEPLVIKFIYPALKEIAFYGGEREALAEMDKTPIPHSRLKASSRDGLALVKELVSGESLRGVTAEGPLSREQRVALLEMTVLYVSLGHTADLSLSNLVWQAPEKRWILIDSGGYDIAPPWDTLVKILSKSTLLGIDKVGFLSALRERLGADSPAWRAVETSALTPYQKTLLEDLHRHDRR